MEIPNSDFEVILDVLAGNRNAFSGIVAKYQGKVRGYCQMMLRDAVLAEDAAQEVFIKAYQSLGRFRGDSSFSTWIYRISANHCMDLQRRAARRKTESWDALLERDGERIENLFAAAQDSSQGSEQADLVAELLSHLPEKTREILLLREAQGLSYQELSEVLNCTLDAVKSRLKRARQELEIKLRHVLKAEGV